MLHICTDTVQASIHLKLSTHGTYMEKMLERLLPNGISGDAWCRCLPIYNAWVTTQLVPVAQIFYMVGGYMENFANKFLSKFERWAGMGTSLGQ